MTAIRRTELHEETNVEREQYNTTAQTTISNTRTAHLITLPVFLLFFFLSSAIPSSHFPNIPPLSSPLQLISLFFPFSIPEFLSSQFTIFSFPPHFLVF